MPLEPTSYAVPQDPNAALMDYRIQGPMAGLMVAQKEQAWKDMLDQQKIQNNNANALNDITVANAQKDVPLTDLARENKMAEQQFTKTNQQQIDESKVLEMMSKKSAAERQMASDRAEAYVAVGQSMPAADDNSPAAQAKYQALRASQSAEVQAKLPPNWSPETHAFVTGLMGQSKVVMGANAKIAEETPKLASEERKALHHDATLIETAKIQSQMRGGDDLSTVREVRAATEAGTPQSPEEVVRGLNAVKNSVVDKSKLEQITVDAGRKYSAYNLLSPKDLAAEAKKLGAPADTNPEDLAVIWKKKEIAKTVAESYSDQFPKAKIRVDGKDIKVSTPEGKALVTKLANNDTVTSTPQTQPQTTPTAGGASQVINGKEYVQVTNSKGQQVLRPKALVTGQSVPAAASPAPAAPAPNTGAVSTAPDVGDTSGDQAGMMEALGKVTRGYNPQKAAGASDFISELLRKAQEFDSKYAQK